MLSTRFFLPLIFTPILFAAAAAGAQTVPPDSQVLQPLSLRARASALPARFELLVWNVLKGERGEAWARDFRTLSATADVLLLQEGMRDSFMPAVLDSTNNLDAILATSFTNNDGTSTGVISASTVRPSSIHFRRSPHREPVTNTPKMSLFVTLPQAAGPSILFVNTHGINFVDGSKFETQMRDIAQVLEAHAGPLVWAGDFNTWNGGRRRFLQTLTQSLGLRELIPEGRTESMPLDHVFVRGCPSARLVVLESIRSSDHKPLQAQLNCP